MTDEQVETLAQRMGDIAEALKNIARGGTGQSSQPEGLEAVTLALAGGFQGTGGASVAQGANRIADAIAELDHSSLERKLAAIADALCPDSQTSVAGGLHAVAEAIQELARAVNSR